MPRKVCVMTSAHPSFDVRIFHKECKSLAAAGYQVTLIAPHSEACVRDGVALKATRVRPSRLQRATLGVWDVLLTALREDADIYHFHDPELIPAGLFLRLCGRKVIYDIHENLPGTVSYKYYLPEWVKKPLSSLIGVIEEAASSLFSALVTATPTLAERFRPHNQNVSVVANFPLLEEFQFTDATKDRKPWFVYLGMTITPQRGGRDLVEAISLLPSADQARLVLVGDFVSPEFHGELQALPGWQKTDALGLLGRAAISDTLSQAFAGMVTIHPEPNYVTAFPVKLFEYMAAGLPVIASDFPVYRQIVEEARCGLLVNPQKPQEIAAAMQYLLDHPREAEQMGTSGRTAVLRKFNWRKEQQTLLDLYDQLLFPAPRSATRPASTPTRQELQ